MFIGQLGMHEVLQEGHRQVESNSRSSLALIAMLVIGLPLIVPYLLVAAVGGSVLRALYPLYILVAAGMIIRNRRPLYPGFMIAVFAFSPFIRRVADYNAGFAVFNLILLAPWIGLLPTIAALIRSCVTRGYKTSAWPFALMVFCIVYGLLNALFRLKVVPGLYEAAIWTLPLGLCAFVMERPRDASETRRAVLVALGLMLPILTAYGVYQFLYAPLWDVFWLSNIDNPTFGIGEPYKIRVWSMMNGPGIAAVFSSLAMILLAGESPLGMVVAACALPLLALTAIRTAWLGLGVGIVLLLVNGTMLSRVRLLAGMGALGFVLAVAWSSTALPVEVQNIIAERLATFSDLSADPSTFDRLQVYDSFFQRLSENPWGEGFGAAGSTVTRQTSNADVTAIDSGLLEPMLIFGVVGGALYFLSFFTLVWQAVRASARLPTQFAAYAGVLCATIAIMPLGTTQAGESGPLVWVALGLLMAEVERRSCLTAEARFTLPASSPLMVFPDREPLR